MTATTLSPTPAFVSGTQKRAAKRQAVQQFVHSLLQTHDTNDTGTEPTWSCCSKTFTTHSSISRHIHTAHADKLAALESHFLASPPRQVKPPQNTCQFHTRRAARGGSDPVTLPCDALHAKSGTVLLFYRYTPIHDPEDVAAFQKDLCTRLGLSGKLRIAHEGLNITVAGETRNITEYVDVMVEHEVLSGLELKNDAERRRLFFKPSEGCVHVFDGLSVKVVDEICPFGVRDWVPKRMRGGIWEESNQYDPSTPESKDPKVVALAPPEFHSLLSTLPNNKDDYILLDVRNHYETRIGHFPSAVLPPIRRFSTLPTYIHQNKPTFSSRKAILTYCTGGIRCEKASAWLSEEMGVPVIMLEGGIHNYLEWVKESGGESLFKGRNYVFDARQSLGVQNDVNEDAVSFCYKCGTPTAALQKCIGTGCHLLVTCCTPCFESHSVKSPTENMGMYCCTACREIDVEKTTHEANWHKDASLSSDTRGKPKPKRRLCSCEIERRRQLYSNGNNTTPVNQEGGR
ncbi:uncharacterized protein SPPG_02387 [Spizellomyces punctatus DAOM BR117]|uniref:Rhodanese domain-containing protein n=1 Tax=Spizellomyces punctatus (strain DAOM BR117) TaxID=645134 RepID=A0A0L0HR54_SPIPD|nr:uncharacterized protein SPPG_02387 [Spizellomyces punctatus DAOM BR117]KND03344.1 hypothetical protein SPPG_02387 [Spizellomyces punctatus DAOM BR117]|eukprot:XP_016611383.1 hypothetical protein SPPG_02387 [Spizellomyces punctatus DAOM BR117]